MVGTTQVAEPVPHRASALIWFGIGSTTARDQRTRPTCRREFSFGGFGLRRMACLPPVQVEHIFALHVFATPSCWSQRLKGLQFNVLASTRSDESFALAAVLHH